VLLCINYHQKKRNELAAVIIKRGLGDNCQTSPHTQITQWTALIAKLTAKSSLKFVLIQLSSPLLLLASILSLSERKEKKKKKKYETYPTVLRPRNVPEPDAIRPHASYLNTAGSFTIIHGRDNCVANHFGCCLASSKKRKRVCHRTF
jgi:hypothetical protein